MMHHLQLAGVVNLESELSSLLPPASGSYAARGGWPLLDAAARSLKSSAQLVVAVLLVRRYRAQGALADL